MYGNKVESALIEYCYMCLQLWQMDKCFTRVDAVLCKNDTVCKKKLISEVKGYNYCFGSKNLIVIAKPCFFLPFASKLSRYEMGQ